jgi:hypothetical protein
MLVQFARNERPDAPLPDAPLPDAPLPDAPLPDAPLPDAPLECLHWAFTKPELLKQQFC